MVRESLPVQLHKKGRLSLSVCLKISNISMSVMPFKKNYDSLYIKHIEIARQQTIPTS